MTSSLITKLEGQCRTCRGTGNILSHGFPPEWWDCPACHGHGARHQFGPAIFNKETTT